MQKITTKSGHAIELYDGIDEMPVVRYQKYNQMMILGAGVGTDLGDIRAKIDGIAKLIEVNEPEKARVELGNLNLQMALTASSIDTKSRAFAAIVKSIDGKPCDDITSDGLKRTAETLDKIVTKEERDGTNSSVKKKIELEVKYYYPEKMQDDHAKMNLLKRRLALALDEVEREVSNEEERKKIDDRLAKNTEVINYGAFERDSDVAFEQGCLAIQEQLHKDPKTMTMMEYYAASKLLEERSRKLEQITNKNRR